MNIFSWIFGAFGWSENGDARARRAQAEWLLRDERVMPDPDEPNVFYPDGSTDVLQVFGPPSFDFHGNHINDF